MCGGRQHLIRVLEGPSHVPHTEGGPSQIVAGRERVFNTKVCSAVAAWHYGGHILFSQVATALLHADASAGIAKLVSIKVKESDEHQCSVFPFLRRDLQLQEAGGHERDGVGGDASCENLAKV